MTGPVITEYRSTVTTTANLGLVEFQPTNTQTACCLITCECRQSEPLPATLLTGFSQLRTPD